jgi:hypothetical protein
MAERRKVRSGTGGSASTRSREPADRDEQEMLEEEPVAPEDDELLGADEPEEADDLGEPDDLEEAEEDGSSGDGRRRPARRSGPAMTAGAAARAALRQIAELTAKQPEGVTEVTRTEDGWTVGIELVEDQRIPSSADILATYQTTMDADGELLSYRRVRRYARGRGDTEEP